MLGDTLPRAARSTACPGLLSYAPVGRIRNLTIRFPALCPVAPLRYAPCLHLIRNLMIAALLRFGYNNVMPKRTDIKKIAIIGAEPIIIGQACEFDYSGTQACKALREEGYEVVLINSNPATIRNCPFMI